MPEASRPECPRCGNAVDLKHLGDDHEKSPVFTMPHATRRTIMHAYKCECGMAFTHTVRQEPREQG